MANQQTEYALILKHTVKITRRSGYTETDMGDRRQSGETVIVTAASVYFEYFAFKTGMGGAYERKPEGDFSKFNAIMFAQYNLPVEDGDLVYPLVGPVGMSLGVITHVKPVVDFDGRTHHIECDIQKIG